jgi:FemAB family protein
MMNHINKNHDQFIIDFFNSFELFVIPRNQNKKLWNETLEFCKYAPVAYTDMNVDFVYECYNGNGTYINDSSVIILWDNKAVAIWPLFLINNEIKSLGFFDQTILPPIFSKNASVGVQKKIIKRCISILYDIAKNFGINSLKSSESFMNNIGLSQWHIQSIERSNNCGISYELYVDLSMDLLEIKNNFRKSYKSLITSGQKIWKTCILEKSDKNIWDEFVNLHLLVSGRKTRSENSWDIHLKSIDEGGSFLIYLCNEENHMIGGGLFNFNNHEGFYAVGAYDRSLFDKPLGHVVQFRAMEELKKRGVNWYKIGLRSLLSDNPTPTEKEISIGDFKSGFATHVFPKYIIDHTI